MDDLKAPQDASDRPPLSEAAKRALAEAQERRRAAADGEGAKASRLEVGGREGPEPVRYGDWEVNGIATDF